MAQPFALTSITRSLDPATAQYIKSGYGQQFTLSDNQVFNQADPVPAEPLQGQRPSAFLLNPNNIPLCITGRAPFQPGQAQYHMTAVAPGPNALTLESDNFDAQGNANGAADFQTLGTGTFRLAPGTPAINSPFRAAGQWTFSILDNLGHVVATATAQLELYFFLGPHALPTTSQEHLLDLLRIAIPDYATIANQQWADVEEAVVENMANNLWALGANMQRRYDVRVKKGGKSRHLLNYDAKDGSYTFNLETFMLKTIVYSNCYDLAVLTMLACDALGCRPDPQNNGATVKVLQCWATAGQPWGYITDGPLFGYATDQSRRCNNPFWDGLPPPVPSTPWHLPQKDTLRDYFYSHCIAVFTRAADKTPRIIDVCHGSIDANNAISIFAGNLNGVQYFNLAVDPVGPLVIGKATTFDVKCRDILT
ncbi:hypothetical protein B0T19DRAFT_453837 [Cercophora scortea]|uniref:Uncharacterized protein n=1 Tax=Cercophora scortea TaxID=314031 RepID=A0AAE0MLE0_9PEZI|nr:hypothetical protein B0T19DRAFT_453837 [Cercophora scortea]